MLYRFGKLVGQHCPLNGAHGAFFASILGAFGGQFAQNHLRVVYEILVDGKSIFCLAKLHPRRLNIRWAVTLLQEDDVGNNFRSGICLERIVRQTDSTQQIGTFRDMLAGSAVFAVHRVAASDKSHDAARTHLVDGFGEKVVVDGKSQLVVRFVVDLILTERHIADCQIIEVPAVGGFKSSYRNVSLQIQLFGDTACDAVQLHTIQAAVLHGIRQHPKEVADTHTRFQDVA